MLSVPEKTPDLNEGVVRQCFRQIQRSVSTTSSILEGRNLSGMNLKMSAVEMNLQWLLSPCYGVPKRTKLFFARADLIFLNFARADKIHFISRARM